MIEIDSKRRKDLAAIHIAIADLGMDDAAYRQLLASIQPGCESSASMTEASRGRLLARLRELGWRPKGRRRSSRPVTAREPLDRKIRALWLDLHTHGIVRDASEAALASYVKRQTGVEALNWVSDKQASKLVESLKRWRARELRQRTGEVRQ